MMKKSTLFLGMALLFFMSLTPIIQAASVPKPVGDIYVQDFAGLLSIEQKAELIRLATQLEDGTSAQIAVLTIDTLEGEDIEGFSNRAFREYELGSAEKNNGVMLVIAMEEREMWVEVGYGLEGALPDGKVGRILDEFTVPYMKQDEPDQAILNTMKVFYEEISKEYNWDGESVNPVQGESSGGDGGGSMSTIITIIIFIVIFFIFSNRGGGMGPGSRGRGGFPMIGPGSFGGFGGSRGGGFRSGGGGSSGGGGAGRSW
ncbi:MAG: TPM domain-containing protein [Paenisporosarcina sp.]